MTATIDISGETHPVAPIDARAVRVLMEAGVLPFDGRVELVDGALIEMSPANDAHGAAMTDLASALRLALPRRFGVICDAAVFLADDLMLAPDILVLKRPRLSHEASGPELDLVVEIASTTLAQDLGWKADRYARNGVAEYWVVDLPNRLLHVHLAPGPDGYADVKAHDWDAAVVPQGLDGAEFRLNEVVGA